MRDQEMARVDVTGTSVWVRKNDAAYEERFKREFNEETAGFPLAADSILSHVRGGGKPEMNLKLWFTMVSIFVPILP